MNSARLIRIRLAGVVCRPSPARRKDSATTKRVKQVTMMSRPGATDRTVITTISWMMRPAALASPGGISEFEARHLGCGLRSREQNEEQSAEQS